VLTLFSTLGLDQNGVLHSGQSVRLHRPLPPSGEATMTRAVTDVWDKGSGAVVVVEDHAVAGGEPLFDLRSTWFVLGGGGFGGERGPSVRDWLAEASGAPDRVLRHRVREDQAALYRLSGDRHPIHIDPEAARSAGFQAPFLHGLCTLGIVTLEVVAELCGGDPERVRALDSRFTSLVELGDELAISAWTGGGEPDVVAVRAAAGERTVLEARYTLSS
jgi:acyl dehydratase